MPKIRRPKVYKKLGLVQNCSYFSTYWLFKNDLISKEIYSDKTLFLIWRCILLSPNEIYQCLHWLKEIWGLVQHCTHHILHNPWLIYEPHWRLAFALNLRKLYLQQLHHLVIFLEWNWKVQKRYLFLLLLNYFQRNINGYVGLDF